MTGVVKHIGGVYVWQGPFEERQVPRDAGFMFDIWSPAAWATNSPVLASNLIGLMDPDARERFIIDRAEVKASLTRSIAHEPSGPCLYEPPNGLSLLPYQSAGISACLGRDSVLLADEMGLGKTIQAIGVVSARRAERVLVVAPAFLKYNWAREFIKWARSEAEIVSGKKEPSNHSGIVIINYDILHNHTSWLYKSPWDMVIYDEAHYLKNRRARRTAVALGGSYKRKKMSGIPARIRMYLTGTPIESAPHELHPILSREYPFDYGSYDDFTARYCAGFMIDQKLIVTGARNTGELQSRLRSTIMIRRLKKDVLAQLPPKRREIVELQIPGISKLARQEAAIFGNRSASHIINSYDRGGEILQLGEIAKVRREIGLAKLDTCVRYILSTLESKGKLIVFGHHKEVLTKIRDSIKGSVIVTGDVPMCKRDGIVKEFQEGDARCFIGNIQAAGVGLTLTAADTVIFVESDWSPSKMTQAEDRAHRIGQTNAVHVINLVASGSLEARIMQAVIRKQEIIDRTLDSKANLMI